MIKDTLKHTINYLNLSEKIKLGLQYLKNNDLKTVKNGKYEILGEDVFINIQDYTSKPRNKGKWEAHRKYIDIQFIIKGVEKIGVGDICDYDVDIAYNEFNDIEFLKTSKSQQFISMKENDFIILYPHEVHMPQIADVEPSYVKKAVLKISV